MTTSSTIKEAQSTKAAYTLSVMLLLLMAAQAVLGLVFPQQYRDVGYVRETWFGNDLVTLLLAVPVLAVGLFLERRGSLLGRLLWIGGLGYGIYNYAFYLFGAVINAFFPLYIITLLLSVISFIFAFSLTDPARVATHFKAKTPVRLIGGYLTFVAVALTAVWLGMWAAHIFTGRPTPGTPEAFKIVAALDLTVMVPALATGGILLWRRHPLGYLISAIAGVQGSLYLVILALNGLLFIVRGQVEAPGELPIWGTLVVATSAFTLLLLAHGKGPGHAD